MGEKRCLPPQQIDALKEKLEETFGKNPLESKGEIVHSELRPLELFGKDLR